MYRAFAPFFEGVRGDRRVTGTVQWERGRLGGIRERLHRNGAEMTALPDAAKMAVLPDAAETAALPTGGMTMRREAGGHLAGEFSRESGGGKALRHPNICLRH